MRGVVETLGIFAGAYALLVGGLALFQRDMIYHPGSETVDPTEAGVPEMVPATVRAQDGLYVTGWYAPPKDPRAITIVFFHGNAGTLAHRAHKARALLDAGYGVLLAGYRGYGGNPGRPSEAGFYADARGAIGWLISRGIPEHRLAVYGESLGTGVAVQMAAEFPKLTALVLEAPYTRLPDLAPPFVLPGLAAALMVDRYDSIAKLPGINTPLLVLHGEQDGVVPVAMGHQMLAAATAEKQGVFPPHAGHNDLWEHGAKEALLDFLSHHTRR